MKDWKSVLMADPTDWLLENTFSGRFQTKIEEKGKPSKWITLNALRVLKKFNGGT